MKKSSKYRIDILVFLLIALCGFTIVGKIFQPGILLLYDNPMHFVEMDYLVKKFIPLQHWIDGWSMQAPLGQPILLYTYQLGGWLIAILNLQFKIDLNIAYKILVYISSIFTPFVLYIFIRKRFGYFAGILGALLFLFQKIHLNLLLNSVWNNYLATGIFVVFFDILDRYYKNLNIKKIALLSVLQALIMLSHLFTYLVSNALIGIYFLISILKPKFKLFLIPIISLFIGCFYIYEFVSSKDWLVGSIEPWLSGSFLTNSITVVKNIFGGFDKFSNPSVSLFANVSEFLLSILSVIGITLFYGKNERSNRGVFNILLLFTFFSVIAFTGIWHSIPIIKNLPFLKTIINKRLLVYIHLALCIFAAYSIKCIVEYMSKKKPLIKAIMISICLFVIIAVSISLRFVAIDSGWTETDESIRKMQDIREVWRWTNLNLDKNSRIIYQSTYGNITGEPVLRKSHVLALGIYYTPFMYIVHCGIGNYYPTYRISDSASGKLFGEPIDSITEEEIIEKMQIFNARYIVTLEPKLEKKISDLTDFINKKRISNFTIFEYIDHKNEWVDFSKNEPKNSYQIHVFSDNYVKIEVNNFSNNNKMRLKVSYHPFWQAYLNGIKSDVEKDNFGLINVKLPERGKILAEFKYKSKKIIPLSISLLSFTLCMIFIFIPHGMCKK